MRSLCFRAARAAVPTTRILAAAYTTAARAYGGLKDEDRYSVMDMVMRGWFVSTISSPIICIFLAGFFRTCMAAMTGS
jgi:hypothetical protein